MKVTGWNQKIRVLIVEALCDHEPFFELPSAFCSAAISGNSDTDGEKLLACVDEVYGMANMF